MTAIRTIEGKDTAYLILHALQYDLVNLKMEQILENVTYARKVHVALPYLGKKLDYEMWREWVLPHRVLDEDLDLWRKDLYDQLKPVVSGKKTVCEVVEALHVWLVEGNGVEKPRIVFGNSENRCKSPSQMLRMGSGSCGELSLMFVAALRAVGIPARHCVMNWRYGGASLHYYCEYWDAQARRWTPLDASDEKKIPAPLTPQERTRQHELGTLAFYAHPGFPIHRDVYHTACLEEGLPVTANMFETRDVAFQLPAGFRGATTAYVWNTDAWRATARGAVGTSPGRPMQLALAQGPARRPVLFTATDGKSLYWALKSPSLEGGAVEMRLAVPGECLRATDYVTP